MSMTASIQGMACDTDSRQEKGYAYRTVDEGAMQQPAHCGNGQKCVGKPQVAARRTSYRKLLTHEPVQCDMPLSVIGMSGD